MKNKYLIILLVGVLLVGLLPLITAGNLGTFKQGHCVSLHQVCRNCTYVNITSIKFPNGTLRNLNEDMTGSDEDYNYTFCDTSLIGSYKYNTCGDLDGDVACENIDFEITQTGSILSTSQGIVYLVFFIILIFAFVGCLYGALRIPWKHPRDITNRIIDINDSRYLKIVFYFFSYIILMFIFGLARAMTYDFLFLQGTAKVFFLVYVCYDVSIKCSYSNDCGS